MLCRDSVSDAVCIRPPGGSFWDTSRLRVWICICLSIRYGARKSVTWTIFSAVWSLCSPACARIRLRRLHLKFEYLPDQVSTRASIASAGKADPKLISPANWTIIIKIQTYWPNGVRMQPENDYSNSVSSCYDTKTASPCSFVNECLEDDCNLDQDPKNPTDSNVKTQDHIFMVPGI